MKRRAIPGIMAVALLAACAPATANNGGMEPDSTRLPAPPPLSRDVLPRGTELEVVLNDTLNANATRVGDRFSASVRTPILTANGVEVIPVGAVVTGLVTGVDDSDHAGDPAYLRLNFIRLTLRDANHPFAAEILATDLAARAGVVVEDAENSAAAGAVAGAVIGGDLRAALEGASLGAGAGSVIALGTTSQLLPAGTMLRLRTTANISLEH